MWLRSAKDEVPGCVEPDSLGSISELETQLIIANRLGFLSKEEIFPLIEKRTLQAFRANKVPARREKCQKPVTSHISRLTSNTSRITSHVLRLTVSNDKGIYLIGGHKTWGN